MVGLTGHDVEQIFNLVQLFSSPLKNTDDVTRFLLATQKAFDSDELVFLYPNPRTNGIDLQRSFSLQRDRTFLSRYADTFWRYDPLYSAELSAHQNMRAFRTEDIVPYSNFVKLKYYFDFLKPQDLISELVIRLYFKSSFLGAISLLRSNNRPFFDKTDVEKAELLIPYIVDKIDVGDVFSRNVQEQRLFEQWLESQAEGIILLDSGFHTLYINTQAELFCALTAGHRNPLDQGADIKPTCVPDVIIQDCRCLSAAHKINRCAPVYDNRIVNLGSQKRYHIQYFIFTSPAPDNTLPNFFVVINNLSRYSVDKNEIILGQAKLSRQEAIVARYAGMGWTNKEIAESIHSSPFTIQNHLKKIFEKTGLKNRTQLANLMKYTDILHNFK